MRTIHIIFMQYERDEDAEYWWRNEPWPHRAFENGEDAYKNLESLGFVEQFETFEDGHTEPTGSWRKELAEGHALLIDGQVLTNNIIAWVTRMEVH